MGRRRVGEEVGGTAVWRVSRNLVQCIGKAPQRPHQPVQQVRAALGRGTAASLAANEGLALLQAWRQTRVWHCCKLGGKQQAREPGSARGSITCQGWQPASVSAWPTIHSERRARVSATFMRRTSDKKPTPPLPPPPPLCALQACAALWG